MQGLHAFQNDGLSKKNLGLCVSECVCVCVLGVAQIMWIWWWASVKR